MYYYWLQPSRWIPGDAPVRHMEARYYSGMQARLMSPDEPLLYSDRSDPASWNLYAYGLNNPLLYTDPSGHFAEREGGPPPGLNPLQELLYRAFLNSLENLQRAAQLGHQLIQSVNNFRNNPNCAAGITGLGQVAGGVSGGIAGAGLFAAGGAGLGTFALPGGGTIGGGAIGFGVGLTAGTAAGSQAGGAIGGAISNIACNVGSGGSADGGSSRRSAAGNMQKQVERGQAPRSVDRVDRARFPYEKDQVYFKDGSALNYDGTWKHGGRTITSVEAGWLTQNGWVVPK